MEWDERGWEGGDVQGVLNPEVCTLVNVHPGLETSALARGLTQMSCSGAEASFSGVHNRTNKIFI